MSKIKKYGKFGKKMLVGASSGIIAGMFLMGVGTTYTAEAAEFSEYSASSYSQNTTENGIMDLAIKLDSHPLNTFVVSCFKIDRANPIVC